jgi:hypothetical protein
MNRALGRMLIRLYPRYWTERSGEEFEALLGSRHTPTDGREEQIL